MSAAQMEVVTFLRNIFSEKARRDGWGLSGIYGRGCRNAYLAQNRLLYQGSFA
jgi:hypothetical protein